MWENGNEDMIITCKDCGEEFTLCGDDRKWYKRKGYELPKRCPSCRSKRREARRKENA